MNRILDNRYQLVEEIGRGGMATVYRAIDTKVEREVALKLLPPALFLEKQFRERFSREAKIVANLEHSAIVPIYDFGEDNEHPFIVMRIMEGGSLEKLIQKGSLPLNQISDVITRIAGAVDAAHMAGLLHRDIKPSNIIFDKNGFAYLTDFGIAKIQEGTTTLTVAV
jgi:serine/threonine protein kinase